MSWLQQQQSTVHGCPVHNADCTIVFLRDNNDAKMRGLTLFVFCVALAMLVGCCFAQQEQRKNASRNNIFKNHPFLRKLFEASSRNRSATARRLQRREIELSELPTTTTTTTTTTTLVDDNDANKSSIAHLIELLKTMKNKMIQHLRLVRSVDDEVPPNLKDGVFDSNRHNYGQMHATLNNRAEMETVATAIPAVNLLPSTTLAKSMTTMENEKIATSDAAATATMRGVLPSTHVPAAAIIVPSAVVNVNATTTTTAAATAPVATAVVKIEEFVPVAATTTTTTTVSDASEKLDKMMLAVPPPLDALAPPSIPVVVVAEKVEPVATPVATTASSPLVVMAKLEEVATTTTAPPPPTTTTVVVAATMAPTETAASMTATATIVPVATTPPLPPSSPPSSPSLLPLSPPSLSSPPSPSLPSLPSSPLSPQVATVEPTSVAEPKSDESIQSLLIDKLANLDNALSTIDETNLDVAIIVEALNATCCNLESVDDDNLWTQIKRDLLLPTLLENNALPCTASEAFLARDETTSCNNDDGNDQTCAIELLLQNNIDDNRSKLSKLNNILSTMTTTTPTTTTISLNEQNFYQNAELALLQKLLLRAAFFNRYAQCYFLYNVSSNNILPSTVQRQTFMSTCLRAGCLFNDTLQALLENVASMHEFVACLDKNVDPQAECALQRVRTLATTMHENSFKDGGVIIVSEYDDDGGDYDDGNILFRNNKNIVEWIAKNVQGEAKDLVNIHSHALLATMDKLLQHMTLSSLNEQFNIKLFMHVLNVAILQSQKHVDSLIDALKTHERQRYYVKNYYD